MMGVACLWWVWPILPVIVSSSCIQYKLNAVIINGVGRLLVRMISEKPGDNWSYELIIIIIVIVIVIVIVYTYFVYSH